jgi:hypothetical protein
VEESAIFYLKKHRNYIELPFALCYIYSGQKPLSWSGEAGKEKTEKHLKPDLLPAPARGYFYGQEDRHDSGRHPAHLGAHRP